MLHLPVRLHCTHQSGYMPGMRSILDYVYEAVLIQQSVQCTCNEITNLDLTLRRTTVHRFRSTYTSRGGQPGIALWCVRNLGGWRPTPWRLEWRRRWDLSWGKQWDMLSVSIRGTCVPVLEQQQYFSYSAGADLVSSG